MGWDVSGARLLISFSFATTNNMILILYVCFFMSKNFSIAKYCEFTTLGVGEVEIQ